MEFSRQEYRSELSFPSLGDLPDPGIKSGSPALQAYTVSFLHFLKNFFFFLFIIFHWRTIALQYSVGFCHTSTWISHRYTYVPPSWASFPPPTPSHPSRLSQFGHVAQHGILVPWPGIEPTSAAREVQSLNHWTTRERPRYSLSQWFNSTIVEGKQP